MSFPPEAPLDLAGEAALMAAIAAMAPEGVHIGCRMIRAGDEDHLLPGEARSIGARHPAIRRASGAARAVAHRLLAEMGVTDIEVPRSLSGSPIWPDGIRGSIAHDDRVAVVAVTRRPEIASLGIDVEAAQPLPEDVAALVATSADRMGPTDPHLAARLLFGAKEAVYKAIFPLDGKVLGYEDIAVDLASGMASTSTRGGIRLRYCTAPRIVTLAFTVAP